MALNREQHQRARAVFHAACELAPGERRRYLDEACAAEPEVRREVESLFAEEQRSLARALDAPASGVGLLRELADDRDAPEPSPIGRYRLLERLGEGGFGTVFLAEQSEPVVRRVALKIIRSGMDSEQVIARFEGERQALAMMDHPGIARVLDAGTTAGGRPYFVMELVHGEPVTRFCDRERLSVRQRLDLFRDICGAVQHAHHKGLVHRDLKPSNVLVAMLDGRPVPKVIDFGIAKATAGRLTDKSVRTALHQVLGTPQYMSPEQASSVIDIDTRSDVYALGVLLYELLVGCTPLDDQRVRSATLAEVQRMILEEEPMRPSLRLAPATSTGAVKPAAGAASIVEVAHARAADPAALIRELRGDLDWIVLKCLEKDRARRYATASALEEDLGRYLEHQPVLATPPSTSYRLRKFVRRNRPAVAAGTTGGLALAAAAAVSIVFGLREGRQRALADAAKERAEAAEAAADERAAELEQVAGFQQEQLSGIDVPALGERLREDVLAQVRAVGSTADAQTPVGDLEALIAECNFTDIALDALDEHYFQPARIAIQGQFAEQPLVEARLLQTLASTMQALGLLAAAEEPQRAALEIRRRELGDEHSDTIESIHCTALLQFDRGELIDSERNLREALAGYRRTVGDDHPSTLRTIASIGSLLKVRGDLAGAEPYYREALERHKRLSGEDHPDTLTSINNMGTLLLAQGKLELAEPYLRAALATARRILGDDHPHTLKSINNLGGVLQAQGRWAEAEPYFREALEKCLRVHGSEHPDTLMAYNNLGGLLMQQGRLAEAEPCHREALEGRRRVLGDAHPHTLNSVNNLAGLLGDQGRLDEAEPFYREALEQRRQSLGGDHPDTIASINNLGWLLQRAGRPREAEACYREALGRCRRVLGDDDRQTLAAIGNLGGLLDSQGRAAETVALLAPAESAMRRAFTDGNSMKLGAALTVLGRCRAALGAFREAESSLLEAYSVLQGAENATAQQRADVLAGLVELYDGWEAAEPGGGHRSDALAWRVRIAESTAPPR